MCELRVIVLVKNKVYLMVRASIYDKKFTQHYETRTTMDGKKLSVSVHRYTGINS